MSYCPNCGAATGLFARECANCHTLIGGRQTSRPEIGGKRSTPPSRRISYIIGNLLLLPGYLVAGLGVLVTVVCLFLSGGGEPLVDDIVKLAVWLLIAPGLLTVVISFLFHKWASMGSNNATETDTHHGGPRGSP